MSFYFNLWVAVRISCSRQRYSSNAFSQILFIWGHLNFFHDFWGTIFLSIVLFVNYLYLFVLCVQVFWLYTWTLYVCLKTAEARRCLGTGVTDHSEYPWGAGIQTCSSARAGRVLNHQATSQFLTFFFFFKHILKELLPTSDSKISEEASGYNVTEDSL